MELVNDIAGLRYGYADPWGDIQARVYRPRSVKATVRSIDGGEYPRRVISTPHGYMCLTTGTVFDRAGRCVSSAQVWLDVPNNECG
jgi:hypothetical protein